MKRYLLFLIAIIACAILATSCIRTEYSAIPKLNPADKPESSDEKNKEDEVAAAQEGQSDQALCPVGPSSDEPIEDDIEGEEFHQEPPYDPTKRPFEDMTDKQIAALLDSDPAQLGSMSVGYTNSGALFNGVPMPKSDRWKLVNPVEAWGTQETVDYIANSIAKVYEEFPETPPIQIGDISDKDGGRLNRHLSHQAGRDADLSWYYKDGGCGWWAVGTSSNLDLPRTWALVRAFFTETDVELILIDRSIQIMLYDYAKSIGEDPEWLDQVFQYPQGGRRGIIRHARGHATHIHVRFYNPKAQEMGRRAYTYMVQKKMIQPPTYYAYHKVQKGQTLGHLAKRYGTSVTAIKRVNGLRSNMIRAGKSYRIPRRGGVKPAPHVAQIPPRKLPPARPGMKKQKTAVAMKAKKTEAVMANPIVAADAGQTIAVGQPHLANGETDKVATEQLDALKAAKTARESLVQAGAVQELPVSAAATKSTRRDSIAQAPKPKAKPAARSSKKWVTYKVRSGDNLWVIARKHNMHVKDIKAWNGLRSNNLKIGQKLRLQVKG